MSQARVGMACGLWGGLTALVFAIGCSARVCSISGVVTYEGQPIQQGEITLTPADGIGPITGAPISAGKFLVSEIKPGTKIVQISEFPALEFPKSTEELAKAAQQGVRNPSPPANLVPANAQGNGATLEVKAGRQTADFHLKKPLAR